MDQQKMQRLLRMLLLLSGVRRLRLEEIKERFDISDSTVYRYLNTIESVGFVLERDKGTYRLQKDSHTRTLQNLLHFSPEEVYILHETLASLHDSSAIKEQLMRKLHVLYDYNILEKLKETQDHQKIQLISQGIREKKQVILTAYRSSHSDSVSDRRLEAFDFLPDYRAIWCLEPESKICKQFKIARIARVKVSEKPWDYEHLHQKSFTDAFRMSGQDSFQVKADLSMKAYNLLIEEYPLAKKHIREESGHYHLDIPVASYFGIGRFVLGLPGEIQVSSPEGFKKFLKEEQKKFKVTIGS